MTAPQRIRTLQTLIHLKDQEVDRLSAEVAQKVALRQRMTRNIDQLQTLAQGCQVFASGRNSALLAANGAGYKSVMLDVAHQQTQDLKLHEADLLISQNALNDASRRKEVLTLANNHRATQWRRTEAAKDQKRQDELAAQTWMRGQK